MTLKLVLLFFCLLSPFVVDAQPTQFKANFILTYPGMTNAGVSGVMTYDYAGQRFAFNYSQLVGGSFTEIYQFNSLYGYNATNPYQLQKVFKIAPYSACSPCAQYGLSYGFPFLNNTATGGWATYPFSIQNRVLPNIAGATDANGCTRYNVNSTLNSFASYFGLKANGQLCYLADTTSRVWTVTGGYSTTIDTSIFNPPSGCKCLQPIDVAISLDRSGSISVESTYFYKAFLAGLTSSFYFNESDPVNTAQLGIVQWATGPWSMSSLGSLNFTQSANNVATAASQVGCTVPNGCDFCYLCGNKKRAEDDETESFVIEEENSRSPTKAPTRNPTRAPTNSPTRRPTRAPTAPTAKPTKPPCTPTPPSDNTTGCTNGYTCTACGINLVTSLYTGPQSTYVYRPTATPIMILITDGNSNTLQSPYNKRCNDTGDQFQTGDPLGCYTDIKNERDYLVSQVPGIVTYAIGVGTDVDTATLDVISGSPARSFVESSWTALIDNINTYILGFCQLPDPVLECGSCCGFCECGVCVPPDTPIPVSDYCSGQVVTGPTAGNCYTTTFQGNPCSPQPCKDYLGCDSSASPQCQYQATVCPVLNPCYRYACSPNVNNGTCAAAQYVCGPPTLPPTVAPTRVPTDAPTKAPTKAPTDSPTRAPTAPLVVPVAPTEEPTGAPTPEPTEEPTEAPTPFPNCTDDNGFYCGENGDCCEDRVTCCCKPGFSGVFCGIPDGVDECTNATECAAPPCQIASCLLVNGTKRCGIAGPVQCTFKDNCTYTYCDTTDGTCKDVDISDECNDNLQCTTDSCNPSTGCVYTPVDCSYVADVCNTAYCNNFALTANESCVKQAIPCPITDNCSIVYCSVNESGCVNQTYTCEFGFIGIIAGITAGAIVGATVAAAFLVAAGMTAGTAVAVSQSYNTDGDSNVKENPMYRPETKGAEGLASFT